MELKRSLLLILLVLVVSLALWYATFAALGITAWNQPQPKSRVLPRPKPVKLSQPPYSRIDLKQEL